MGMFLSASYQFAIINTLDIHRSLHLLDRLHIGGPLDVRGFSWNTIGARADSLSCIGGATSAIGVVHIYRYVIIVFCLHITVMEEFHINKFVTTMMTVSVSWIGMCALPKSDFIGTSETNQLCTYSFIEHYHMCICRF